MHCYKSCNTAGFHQYTGILCKSCIIARFHTVTVRNRDQRQDFNSTLIYISPEFDSKVFLLLWTFQETVFLNLSLSGIFIMYTVQCTVDPIVARLSAAKDKT